MRSLRPQRRYSAVYVLMAITVVAFVLDQMSGGQVAEATKTQSYLVLVENQWWRLVTPIVAHGNLLHLAFNMYALYIVGPILEDAQGTAKFLVIYFVSAIAASTASIALPVFLTPQVLLPVRDVSGALIYPGGSIGASGAIFGLFGAMALLLFRRRDRAIFRSQLTQILVLIAINLVYGFFVRGIDNKAHIGGLIAGAVIALGYDLAESRIRLKRYWWGGAALVLVVCVVALVVARSQLRAVAASFGL